MNLGILQDLGLTQNEAKIYEVLIENNKLSTGEISSKSGIHRRNVYDSISRLSNKGLIFTIIGQEDNIYQAVSPIKLKNLLEQSLRDEYFLLRIDKSLLASASPGNASLFSHFSKSTPAKVFFHLFNFCNLFGS